MGMDLNIYTKGLSVDLIPKIKKRFADFHMDIEIHPVFKFDEHNDTGFLPIKLKVQPGYSKQYDNIDYEIITGFELLFSDYDFEEDLKSIQRQTMLGEKKSFLSKLFGGRKTVTSIVADKDIDKLLKQCKKNVLLNWKPWNKSNLRISLFFAAFLAELTDGVIFDPQNGHYLDGHQALQIFPSEIDEYEQSFSTDEFEVEKFEAWL